MVRAGFDKFPHGFSVFSRVDYFFSHDFSHMDFNVGKRLQTPASNRLIIS